MSKIKTASFLGFVAIATGLLNYASHPILIANLPENDYVQVMMYSSLLAIASIPALGFSYAMLEFFRSGEREQFFSREFFRKMWSYSAFYVIFVIIFLSISLAFLNISFSFFSIIFILAFIPTIFSSYYGAFLQSKEFFILLGIFSLIASVVRFLCSIAVIFFPSDIAGMMVFFSGHFVGIILSFIFGKKFLRLEKFDKNQIFSISLREKIPSFFWYIILSALFVLLQNIDNIFVKALFPISDVALYMAVGVFAKFALVIISILETISLPTLFVISADKIFLKTTRNLFFMAIFGFLASFFILPFAGNFVLSFIKNWLSASYILWAFFGAAMISLGFFFIFAKTLVAQKVSFKKIFIFPTFLLLGFFFVDSLEKFIILFSLINFSLFISSFFSLWKGKLNN